MRLIIYLHSDPVTKITNAEQQDSADREAIAIAPIGTPLLAGPGSITTAIIYFNGTGIAIFSINTSYPLPTILDLSGLSIYCRS